MWDGTGVWLASRRLHRGRFVWVNVDAVTCKISEAQWSWLIAGVDWQRLSAQPDPAWKI